MEFIHGVFLSEYLQVSHRDPERVARWRDENKIRRSRVARRVLFSHLRQSLEDNLFHCDLHPGNLVLLRDSQIALIDFGSVGFAERDFLRKYDLYMDALSTGQYSKMVDLYWLFVVNLPPTDLSDLKEQAVRRLQAWEARRRTFDLPYEQRSLGSLSDELIRLVGEQGISLDWTFLRLNRAWFTMDISFRELMPHADIKKLTLEYYRQKERRSRRALLPSPVSAAQWFQAAIELPSHAYEQAIYRGAVIRRLAMVFEGTTTRFSNLFASIFGFFRWAVVLTVAAALLGMLQQVAGLAVGAPGFPTSALASLPPLDAQVWALVMVVLLHVHRTLTLLKRRFEQGEAKVPGA
jgi:ubiquinone biosynthesis protein